MVYTVYGVVAASLSDRTLDLLFNLAQNSFCELAIV